MSVSELVLEEEAVLVAVKMAMHRVCWTFALVDHVVVSLGRCFLDVVWYPSCRETSSIFHLMANDGIWCGD